MRRVLATEYELSVVVAQGLHWFDVCRRQGGLAGYDGGADRIISDAEWRYQNEAEFHRKVSVFVQHLMTELPDLGVVINELQKKAGEAEVLSGEYAGEPDGFTEDGRRAGLRTAINILSKEGI